MLQIIVLTYLNRLCLHWIQLEYPRTKGNLTYSFFSTGDNHCTNPLESIACLVRAIQNYSELGLTKLTYFAESHLLQAQKETYIDIYVKEVIGMFMLVSGLSFSLTKLGLKITSYKSIYSIKFNCNFQFGCDEWKRKLLSNRKLHTS